VIQAWRNRPRILIALSILALLLNVLAIVCDFYQLI
jgi:hypothetical protein